VRLAANAREWEEPAMKIGIVATVVVAMCIGCTSRSWLFKQRRFVDEGAIYLEQFINAVNEGRELEAAASWNPKRRTQGVKAARYLRWALDQYSGEDPHYVLVRRDATWDYNMIADVALYPTGDLTTPLWCEGWEVDLTFPGFRIEGIKRTGVSISCP